MEQPGLKQAPRWDACISVGSLPCCATVLALPLCSCPLSLTFSTPEDLWHALPESAELAVLLS